MLKSQTKRSKWGQSVLSGHSLANQQSEKRGGFTLLEIVVAVGVLAVVSAMVMSVFGRTRVPARRAQCDVQLKQIALATDTFRQERGRMPAKLADLISAEYLTADAMRCPSDPDAEYDAKRVIDPTHTSYGDFYVIREPRDSGELPILVCPFHEKDGDFGIQAFKSGYTKQFSAHPARLQAGEWSGVVTISRPGVGVLSKPVAAGTPLLLRGGDKIDVGAGEALIRFEDGSTATIGNNSQMSVMQSFTEGQRSGKLYTLVRQFKGKISYYVNPGNRFDVATPTATAGALGTRFSIELLDNNNPNLVGSTPAPLLTKLVVEEHVVALSSVERTIEIVEGDQVVENSLASKIKIRKPRILTKSNRPTTRPTTTPTTTPRDDDDD
jgi:prepilin-type N-terminal cleavage/methylation domain-containing protein